MVSKIPGSSKNVFVIIQEIISMGEVEIPPQFNGAGAPGNTLEYLLDVKQNNYDAPDFHDWEIKFHGVNHLKDGDRDHIAELIKKGCTDLTEVKVRGLKQTQTPYRSASKICSK